MGTNLGRRGFLKGIGLVGLAGAAPLLAACAAQPTPAPETKAPETKAPAQATSAPKEQATAKPDAPATKAPASSDPVHIVIHFTDNNTYGEFVEKFSQEYVVKQLSNVTIEVQRSPGNQEHFTKLLSLHAAGRLGDLAYAYPAQGWLAMLSARGMFADHDDLVKGDNFDLKQYYDNAIEVSRVDGVLRSLPWHSHSEHWTWFLNLDAFEEAGVKVPPLEPPYQWSIEDEVEMGMKLTKRSGDKVERFGISGNTSWLALLFIVRAFGGEILSDDGKQVRLGEKPARAAVKWLYDRMYTHKYAPTSAQMEGNDQQMFVSGKVAMHHAGASLGVTMLKSIGDRFRMGVVAGPIGPKPDGRESAGVGPNTLGVLTSSKAKDQAWEVLKLHTGKEAGVQKVLFGAGAPGGRPDCYEDPRVIEAFPGAKVVAYQLTFGWPEQLPWNLRVNELQTAVQQTMGNVWLNSVPVDEGIDLTIKAMEEVLQLPDVRKE